MSEEKKDPERKEDEASKAVGPESPDDKKEADSSSEAKPDELPKAFADKAPEEPSPELSTRPDKEQEKAAGQISAVSGGIAADEAVKPSAPEAGAAKPAAEEGNSDAAASVDPEKEAKIKAAAEAREARARERAARAAEGGEGAAAPAASSEAGGDAEADKEAKAKAAAEARAARAKERAAKSGEGADGAPAAPKEPSPKQPVLDRAVQLLKENVAQDAVEESSINERGGHRPTIVVKGEHWPAAAELLKSHAEFDLTYLRNVSGVDMETHLEAVYHLISLSSKEEYTVKVKTNRDEPTIPSVTPVWSTANWNEREIYDLFGIDFPGHPDLRRIMMSDDWVGHPLRKDYEPLDPEV
ncbi:NADH-quinone oxidoreductase subunit C [Paenibacillus sp. MBLB4367]|uniref:NADH-quinone oxidoreductase subunit C n=1 Tax=Paenibacillus sp. MBLB4367 TaxID=3384767 RepID=UPI0039083251